ncbi:MAG: nitroreductase family protein [Rhodothermales bacterium]|nr:nitroreductase family protein [Rhodothermales bacterium]
MSTRRSVRSFTTDPVPRDVIENCISAAGTAPSGANRQPWHFVVVEDPEIKRQIRQAAENEEKAFYHERAPDDWLQALAPLGTDENKPFLEDAPYLIVVFAESYGVGEAGQKIKNYYVSESVGISTGVLITALHEAGLATLTHTPSPMKFLNQILGRPENERAFVLMPVGFPADDAVVPDVARKGLGEIATWI